MKTLLLCGYRPSTENEAALGLERDGDGVTLIDRRIAALQGLGLTVICVVAGLSADEQLRSSRKMHATELTFDEATPTTLMSNVRAGLTALNEEACFVIPVEIPVPPREIWDLLRHEYARLGLKTAQSVLQAGQPSQGAPWHFGFPLLFTHQGCHNVQNTADLSSLVDARLQYLHLAPETKPL